MNDKTIKNTKTPKAPRAIVVRTSIQAGPGTKTVKAWGLVVGTL